MRNVRNIAMRLLFSFISILYGVQVTGTESGSLSWDEKCSAQTDKQIKITPASSNWWPNVPSRPPLVLQTRQSPAAPENRSSGSCSRLGPCWDMVRPLLVSAMQTGLLHFPSCPSPTPAGSAGSRSSLSRCGWTIRGIRVCGGCHKYSPAFRNCVNCILLTQSYSS